MIAGAIAVAALVAIALLVLRLPRAKGRSAISADGNGVLIAFAASFLAVTVATGIAGDYIAYDREWRSILAAQDPWQTAVIPVNSYGPLFTLMAIGTLVSPIANKLLFAFSYALYVTWLLRVRALDRGSQPPAWVPLGLLILNPFPWQQIAWFGYFDILVGLACVASVHSLTEGKERLSGAFLSLGILLKFMPIVILPLLAVNGRRFNGRLVGACLALVALGFLACFLIWGPSVFTPLTFAATRTPQRSIYTIMNSGFLPFKSFANHLSSGELEEPVIIAAMLATLVLYLSNRISLLASISVTILATLLAYRSGYANYQMVLFCLVTYWLVSEWGRLNGRAWMAAFLIAYFAFMAAKDFDVVAPGWPPLFHPNGLVLIAFVSGCLMLIGLIRMSTMPARDQARAPR